MAGQALSQVTPVHPHRFRPNPVAAAATAAPTDAPPRCSAPLVCEFQPLPDRNRLRT
ncbi:hypothetical protein [Brachybacterium sacelli]|uniref:Uncharacterized protein n=1 Tax=Brachybacterium sacelli TaxID=173364 RepID=A0ABS4WZV0_9MICO|nr:hypothetical protein [Brachybacterium sacelli]